MNLNLSARLAVALAKKRLKPLAFAPRANKRAPTQTSDGGALSWEGEPATRPSHRGECAGARMDMRLWMVGSRVGHSRARTYTVR